MAGPSKLKASPILLPATALKAEASKKALHFFPTILVAALLCVFAPGWVKVYCWELWQPCCHHEGLSWRVKLRLTEGEIQQEQNQE